MSTLHEKLLIRCDPQWWGVGEDRPRWLNALTTVVERHAPAPCPGPSALCFHLEPHTICPVCSDGSLGRAGRADYPCDETRAIAEALGIGETP